MRKRTCNQIPEGSLAWLLKVELDLKVNHQFLNEGK